MGPVRSAVVSALSRNLAVNTGRENNSDVVCRRPARDQTPDDEIDYLAGCSLSGCIGHDDEDAFAGIYDVFKRWRINRQLKPLPDLDIRKPRLLNSLTKYLETLLVIFERNDGAAIF